MLRFHQARLRPAVSRQSRLWPALFCPVRLRPAMFRLTPILSIALAFALVVAAPAGAGTTGTTYYTCSIDVASNVHDCTDGVVTVTSASGTQRVARVDLGSYVRLDAFIDVCNPSGWWSHFGDSPSDNGYGGDAGHTEHDAEAYALGGDFQTFGTYNTSRGGFDLIYTSSAVISTNTCSRPQWTILEDRVALDDDDNPADSPRVNVTSIHGFEVPPYDEPDSEDPSGTDAGRWYVGINRTVGTSFRSGSGAQQVCFVLSTTTTPSAATLSALCP